MKEKRDLFGGILLLMGAAALVLGKLGFLEGIGFWTILWSVCLAAVFINGVFKGSFGMMLFSLIFLAILNDDLIKSFGFLEGIGFWTILWSVCLAIFFIKGIVKGSFGMMLFSLALFVILNDRLLGLESITPWPVLGTALLGTAGLNLLFPGFGKRRFRWEYFPGGGGKGAKSVAGMHGERCNRVETYEHNGTNVSCENVFGESVKYISGEIGWVDLNNTFGVLQVYFSEACLSGGRAQVNITSSFGKMVLYIPSNWKVILNARTNFGSRRVSGREDSDESNVLEITGEVNFGNLEVVYVGRTV